MDKNIISAIESELEYQNKNLASVGLTNKTHIHSAPEWLLIIELQVAKAKEKWYKGDHNAVSDQLRKITATAVVAMDQCGVVNRIIPKPMLEQIEEEFIKEVNFEFNHK